MVSKIRAKMCEAMPGRPGEPAVPTEIEHFGLPRTFLEHINRWRRESTEGTRFMQEHEVPWENAVRGCSPLTGKHTTGEYNLPAGVGRDRSEPGRVSPCVPPRPSQEIQTSGLGRQERNRCGGRGHELDAQGWSPLPPRLPFRPVPVRGRVLRGFLPCARCGANSRKG